MKYSIILLALLALSACTQTMEVEEVQLNLDNEQKVVTSDSLVVHELRLLKDKTQNSAHNSLNEEFLPNTLYVKKGDKVRISVLSGDASFISVNNVAHSMKAGIIEFYPQKGEYVVVCEDCEDKATAIIRVA